MTTLTALAELRDADRALVRSVDGLDDDAWAAPSLLPGWTRGHVVAHLALNAEALAGALVAVGSGSPAAMYRTAQARDDDIEDLAVAAPTALRSRLLGSVTDLADALAALPDDRHDVAVERVPGGGPHFSAGQVATVRLREVEIHHVDLDVGRTASDWSPGFARSLLDLLTEGRHEVASCTLHAVDLDVRWSLGDPGVGPTVSGPAGALGWWLTGRGDGAGLSSDSGVLPRIPEW